MIESPFRTRRVVKPVDARPWRLCPEPSLWSSFGVGEGGTELETLHFLEALVVLLKPRVIVESGTFKGSSAAALARGCRTNGIGHVYSFETDQALIESEARPFIEIEGLAPWVTLTHADATQVSWEDDALIDLMFCDGGSHRFEEIRHFRGRFSARAVVVAHDAAAPEYGWEELSEFHQVLLPSALGLMMLQMKT